MEGADGTIPRGAGTCRDQAGRCTAQVYPRPKEFILKHRVSEVLTKLLDSDARGEDAVRLEAQKLLNAFHINVLL